MSRFLGVGRAEISCREADKPLVSGDRVEHGTWNTGLHQAIL